MRRDDWLLHQLPVGMVEDGFLARFLMIFQTIADTEMHQIDTLAHMFDPTVAPDVMVRALGSWIGIDWIDSSLPDDLQRRIVREYSSLVRPPGMSRRAFVEACRSLAAKGEQGVRKVGDLWVAEFSVFERVASRRTPKAPTNAKAQPWTPEAALGALSRPRSA